MSRKRAGRPAADQGVASAAGGDEVDPPAQVMDSLTGY